MVGCIPSEKEILAIWGHSWEPFQLIGIDQCVQTNRFRPAPIWLPEAYKEIALI
jgi:hypothetical protein